MITQWKNNDMNASWEKLADALANVPNYGCATGTRLRRAVGLPGKGWTVYCSTIVHHYQRVSRLSM